MAVYFKRIVAALALLLAVSLSSPPAGAGAADAEPKPQSPPATESAAPASMGKTYTGERITLEFQNADIREIVEFINEVSGEKIVVSDEVNADLTITLQDVPWDQALDVILSSKNLGIDELSDGILNIYTQETLQSIREGRALLAERRSGCETGNGLVIKVFTVKYVPVDLASERLSKFKSERGKIVVSGNDIYVQDKLEAVDAMRKEFWQIDRALIVVESYIVESSVAFVEHFGFKIIDVQPGTPPDFVDDAKARRGNAPPQINGGADSSAGEGLVPRPSTLLNAIVISSDDAALSHTFGASQDPVWPRSIPSSRRTVTLNGQEVSIEHFKHRPRCKSGGEASTSTAANIHLKEWMVGLNIKPHIEENGNDVTLDISLTGYTTPQRGNAPPQINGDLIIAAGNGLDSPLTANKPRDKGSAPEAKAKITIKNGETLAIGGIYLDDLKSEPQRGNAPPQIRGGVNTTAGKELDSPLAIVPLKEWLDFYDYQPVGGKNTELMIFITVNIFPIVI